MEASGYSNVKKLHITLLNANLNPDPLARTARVSKPLDDNGGKGKESGEICF